MIEMETALHEVEKRVIVSERGSEEGGTEFKPQVSR